MINIRKKCLHYWKQMLLCVALAFLVWFYGRLYSFEIEHNYSLAAKVKMNKIHSPSLIMLNWLLQVNDTVEKTNSCLKEVSLEASLELSAFSSNCSLLPDSVLFDYKLYDLINIWKPIPVNNLQLQSINKFYGKCAYTDSANFVAVDIPNDLSLNISFLNLIIKYKELWPESIFVFSNDSPYVNLVRNKGLPVCTVENNDNYAVFRMVNLCDYVIVTESYTSYFLALYLPNRVIKDIQFCKKYRKACPRHWIDINNPFDKSKRSIPYISNEIFDLIKHEEVTATSSDNILYRKYSKYLSYLNGQYISYPSNEKFTCCSWDKGWDTELYDNPLCAMPETNKCGTIDIETNKTYFCKGGGQICKCASAKETGLKWVWTTKRNGDIPDIDGDNFCKLLGNRTIYVLGDSTMRQINAVLSDTVTRAGGKCTPQIQTKTSDFLMPIKFLSNVKERFNSLDHRLNEILKESGGDALVIMTVGPHINVYEDYFTVLKWIKEYLNDFKRKHSHLVQSGRLRFIWKSTSPPHAKCKKFESPVLPPKVPAIDYPGEKHKFKFWAYYPNYDRLALGYFQDSAIDGYIDISPLYLRVDGHSWDCLHFCIDRNQGCPLDIFVYLVYQVLLDEHSERYLFQWD